MGGLDVIGAVPLLGRLLSLLAATVGLGAVLPTRFGTREFVSDTAALTIREQQDASA
jgi:hypothetical protein